MKIGILTLAIAENYGGTIQAVALYRLLQSKGHDVVLIYKVPYIPIWKSLTKKLLLKIPFHNIANLKTFNELEKERLKRKAFHRPFIKNEILNISDDLRTKKDLQDFATRERFDAVIVGSDQVWRKDYIDDKFYQSFFLDFITGTMTRKISYAASFGKDYWEGSNDEEDISKLLHDFTAVSTREASGTLICKNTFNYHDAVHVLDPTLLMNKEFYLEKIIANYDTPKSFDGGLLTYVLDEAKEKHKMITHLKNTFGLDSVNHLKGFDKSGVTYTVPEWLRSFACADYVITDSFHGMVFSIIFEKDFTVVGNANRGLDRFTSLLSLLGLMDRLVFTYDDLQNDKQESIEYKKVNKLLEVNRKLSLSFLLYGLQESK
ncbi:polysaccharide pyruvyl transferase family protein [Glaciecola sp. SC05]|uniref:polysaccharide pyruvyl transferase family protein n=1 Tax=Glaciecola sp. SC05 TaxID=1987355 RepID=UPI003528D3C3